MSTELGRMAESIAGDFLIGKGFDILDKNWRTRWCEIDIVAKKDSSVYFVEVKYRGRNNWGDGLDYITASKLKQMRFAAEFWIAKQKSNGDYRLAAVELTGTPPHVTHWLDDIY